MDANSAFPKQYSLVFDVDLEKFKFSGFEDIFGNLKSKTKEIFLNSKNLEIKKAEVRHNGIVIVPGKTLDNEKETLILSFDKEISGDFIIHIEFEGSLSDDLSGFYRSKYLHNGKEKYLATTQFEAPYARKAFPCFDEPGKKAEFDVSLLIDEKLKGISNMPVEKEEKKEKKKLLKFFKSPPMSTYLLYLGVGEFEFLKENYEKRTEIRIATTPGKKEQGKFALDLTKKFLKYFEDYSGINYPLPKLDLIAIPDFAAGAMENWGAITFREILLLSSKDTSFRIKRRIAEVVAHELWHQWSGNLVTMKWWNDLWLNESFATYMAFKAMDNYFPEWKVWDYYLEFETLGALEQDSLKSTHPISVNVKSPNEIEEIFDSISYGKGGSVLRMIDDFLGEENFRKGVASYLNEFKYKNTVSEDFWNHLSKSSKIPVKEIANSWINQKGYPLVKVSEKNSEIIIEQESFQEFFKGKTWAIPLTIQTGDGIEKFLFKEKKIKVKLKSEFLKINYNQSGFFRVKYSLEHLKKIESLIKQKKLNSLDLFGIENDLFNLALHGKISVDYYLNFVKIFSDAEDYLVLSDIYWNFSRMEYIFSDSKNWESASEKFRKYLEPGFLKKFRRLGWEPKPKEKINDTLLRPLTIHFLSFSKNREIFLEGVKRIDKHHPDVRAAIYNLASNNGSDKEYKKIMENYLKSEKIEEKTSLLSSLYNFKDESLLKNSLDFAFSEKVRLQDLTYAFNALTSNYIFKKFFLEYAKQNSEKFMKHKNTFFIFSRFLRGLIISSMDNLSEIKDFLKGKDIEYKKTLAESFEIAELYENFLAKNANIFNKFFQQIY